MNKIINKMETVLYANFENKSKMPKDLDFEEIEIHRQDCKIFMPNGDILFCDFEIDKLIKIDDRYYSNSKILYAYDYVKKNSEMAATIAGYADFIMKYINQDNIIFCRRCGFGIFCYMPRTNSGGFIYECIDDDLCDSPILQDLGVECQCCDYQLCGACENGNFDYENLEFNILLIAVVLGGDQVKPILADFPSKNKYADKLIDFVKKRITFEKDSEWWRNIYLLIDDDDIKNIIQNVGEFNNSMRIAATPNSFSSSFV